MDQNDIWRVTAKLFGDDNVSIQNVWHIRKVSVGTVADSLALDDIAGALDGLYEGIDDIISTEVSPEEIGFYDVTNDVPLPSQDWDTFAGGAAGGVAVPSGVAYLLLLRTGVKRVTGRKFFGQGASGYLTGGNWNVSALTPLAAMGALVITSFIGASSGDIFQWGTVDQFGAFWSFNEAVVKGEPAYQRRRRLGSGI